MGISIDLSTVNWLAHILQPNRPIPRLKDPFQERQSLKIFLERLPDQFLSSKKSEHRVRQVASEALTQLRSAPSGQTLPLSLLEKLQQLLSGYTWIGLIVPSMENNELDDYLSSRKFLRALVYEEEWPDSGLILQPENFQTGPKALLDVFPAFQTALNEMTRWPGMLFWTPHDESVFLSFPTKTQTAVRECAGWAVSNLKISRWRGLKQFKSAYLKRFPQAQQSTMAATTLLHISDLHIGSPEAATGLPRLQQLLRNTIAEVPKGQKVISVVTGDLIDSPKQEYHDIARQFIDILRNLTAEPPVIVLGNHDVRNDGYLSEDLRMAIRMPTDKMRWINDRRLGLVCFNSVIGGNLAKGRIGAAQLGDAGSEIDMNPDWREYTLIGVLHHHPVPVNQPDWYAKPLYERMFGKFFEKTDELEDAEDFRDFAKERRFAAVMHGHKHVPRVTEILGPQNVAVFGCGSSVGKVPTKDNKLFLSINRIDVNHESGRMSCRLMVERTLGAGMKDWETHELIYSQRL